MEWPIRLVPELDVAAMLQRSRRASCCLAPFRPTQKTGDNRHSDDTTHHAQHCIPHQMTVLCLFSFAVVNSSTIFDFYIDSSLPHTQAHTSIYVPIQKLFHHDLFSN